jgi:hypothetical protein
MKELKRRREEGTMTIDGEDVGVLGLVTTLRQLLPGKIIGLARLERLACCCEWRAAALV